MEANFGEQIWHPSKSGRPRHVVLTGGGTAPFGAQHSRVRGALAFTWNRMGVVDDTRSEMIAGVCPARLARDMSPWRNVAQHQPPREACRRAGVDPLASFPTHLSGASAVAGDGCEPRRRCNAHRPVRPPFGTLAACFVLARFTYVLWAVFLTL